MVVEDQAYHPQANAQRSNYGDSSDTLDGLETAQFLRFRRRPALGPNMHHGDQIGGLSLG